MHVTRVELDNIKVYEHAAFAFERGTNAIVGRNGAGKTTIIEAIAWTLFDSLEYSKEDFLRRGAKKGEVRVTFTGADERLYTVYRDTGNGYYIYDPILNAKLATNKQDVRKWLNRLLNIDEGTETKALFTSAVGVPQGSFTADFLRPASFRKATFDRLLKTEEYRQSADKLKETVTLIKERAGEASDRIARAEGQLINFNELTRRHAESLAQSEELRDAQAKLHNEIIEVSESLADFQRRAERVIETTARAQQLAFEYKDAERRLAEARRAFEEATTARELLQQTEEDSQAHVRALETLNRLEIAREERDRVRASLHSLTLNVQKAEAASERLGEELEAARQAQTAAVDLLPSIAAQEDLEREREYLVNARAGAAQARERVVQLDRDLVLLRESLKETREEIAQATASQDIAKQIDALESERIGLTNEEAKMRDYESSREYLTKQQMQTTRERERLRRNVERLEAELAQFTGAFELAAKLSQIEAQDRELGGQIARLRAHIERDQRMQREVVGGFCPILSQKCLNIGEGESLETYFVVHLEANTNKLSSLEMDWAEVAESLRAAREAQTAAARFETLSAQLAGEQKLLAERDAEADETERALAQIPIGVAAKRKQIGLQIAALEAELIAARDAQLRAAKLDALRQRQKEITDKGTRLKDERAEWDAAANVLPTLERELLDAEKRLREMNDPRGQARLFNEKAARENEWRTKLQKAENELAVLREQIIALDAELAKFATLDDERRQTILERDRTQAAHHEHLTAATLARLFDERQQTVRNVESELNRAAHASHEAESTRDKAINEYDRASHEASNNRLNRAREEAARVAAQLEAVELHVADYAKEIKTLEAVRAELDKEKAAQSRLRQLHDTTDFIRDTLKAAGPVVTESYLFNISQDANVLFREITGEMSRSLAWTRDYEIQLEEDGYTRAFPNLSGGEQMAAALAVRLALLKQLSDIRVAFFDEPTTNMDAERRARLAQQIGQIRNFDQLFVISHDDTFEEAVDHVVAVGRDEATNSVAA